VIVKRSTRSSDQPSSFGRLVRYVTRSDSPDKPRPAAAWTVNCGVEDPELAARVVEATQALNTRVQSDKTYHLIVSFAAGDDVSLDAMKEIEERLARAIGFGEHQRVCALHTDTDHPHLHMAISRINPATRRAHAPRLDFRTLSREAAAIEREFGLALTHDGPGRAAGLPERAAQMESHSGQRSFASWMRERLELDGDAVHAARSWTELHRALAAFDVEVRRRGAGFVIAAGSGRRAKASAVHPSLAAGALVRRLGPFEPAAGLDARSPKDSYSAPPISADEAQSPLWAEYRAERRKSAALRRSRFDAHREARADSFALAKDAWARQRELINGDRSLSRSARWRAFETLAQERRRWVAAAVADSRAAAASIREEAPLCTWKHWLAEKADAGNERAAALLDAGDAAPPAPGAEPPARADALRKWIDARNATRQVGLREPPPEHRLFAPENAGTGAYRGIRKIDRHQVALVERGGRLLVVPVSPRQAVRLKRRRAVGDPVRVDRAGRFSVAQELSR